MSKTQVQDLIGSPSIVDPFHNNEWQYINHSILHERDDVKYSLVLTFDADKLANIDKSGIKSLPELTEEEKKLENKRLADEKAAAEAKKKAIEEAKRIAKEKALEEQRLKQKALAEAKAKADAEKKRIAKEKQELEAKKLADEQAKKKAQEEANKPWYKFW